MYLGRQIPSSLVLLGRRRRRRRHFFKLELSDIFSIAPSFPSSISRKRPPPLFVPRAKCDVVSKQRDALPKEEEEEDKTKPLSLFKVSKNHSPNPKSTVKIFSKIFSLRRT